MSDITSIDMPEDRVSWTGETSPARSADMLSVLTNPLPVQISRQAGSVLTSFISLMLFRWSIPHASPPQEGAPRVQLALPPRDQIASPAANTVAFTDIYRPPQISRDPADARRLSAATISQFFLYSFALSASKETSTSQWFLRVNPSSGNLHPVEAYCITPDLREEEDRAAVYHYSPERHCLETRCTFPLSVLRESLLPREVFSESCFLVILTAVHWREAWK